MNRKITMEETNAPRFMPTVLCYLSKSTGLPLLLNGELSSNELIQFNKGKMQSRRESNKNKCTETWHVMRA